ncbi:MAG: mandelate racemase/muconate lactonizing enzyme family protein [Bacteroidales bacterium]
MKNTRRKFVKNIMGGAAGAGAVAMLSSFRPSKMEALAPAPEGASPQVDIENLKITKIEYVRMRFPGTIPLMWNAIVSSGGGPHNMNYLEVHTNQGIVGRSIPKGPSSMNRGMIEIIKDENPFDVERIWDRMYRFERKPVAKGDYIKAMGSVDIALWDIIGKALNLPVYRVLGGFQKKIRVYAAGGYYQEGKSTLDLAKEMEGYVAEGFRAVKMKVGGASFNEDVERVRAVRDAIGPDIDLMLDANNRWLAYEAILFGRAVQKYNPYWFEEPVEPDDFKGCAEVKQALDMAIVAGENEFTIWGARDLIEAGSADILNLDTVKAGGITEYRKIAALASAFHIPVAPHGNPHMAVHLLASTPNTLVMETYPGTQSQYNPILPLFPVKDGYVDVPDVPGLGIDGDPKLIEKYRYQ